MYSSCLEKQKAVKSLFAECLTEEDKYSKIIDLGRNLPHLDSCYKNSENIVKGCQSLMYMRSFYDGNVMTFTAESDALISSGLAALLIMVYSGEQPETILKCPPDYLTDLGISASLTPNRANGLYSMHLKMKQEALKALISQKKPT